MNTNANYVRVNEKEVAMSDMHFSTTASSTCCGNDTRDADRLGSVEINPLFARPKEARSFSKNRIPDTGSLPETAYQVVHDDAMLDGNARLNLATFVGTWMDDYANRIYM